MSATLLDVCNEIKLDHDNVRDLFRRFKASTSDQEKRAIANTLIREMAIHSDAEEVSVYNHFASVGLGDTAEHNKEEHAEVKKLLYEADATDAAHENYDEILSRAVTAFIEHAKEEEDVQFSKIRAAISPSDNDKLAKEFLAARGKVPSRPHPSAPQTGGIGQKVVGMQGQISDKLVEMVQGREFAPVKFTHPEI